MIQTIVDFLNIEMKEPLLYGSFKESWFHYLSLFLMMIGMLIVMRFLNKREDQDIRKFLLLSALIMILFEVYKQWVLTYQHGSYPWYIFPFQFCSTPMYILFVASFIKNKQVYQALLSFIATFGMFAGLAVMLYPATVFVSTLGINIQTMVHHGAMAIIGVGLSVKMVKEKTLNFKGAIVIFILLVGFASILNIIHNVWIHIGTFNMFFINPLYENEIPVLSIFQPLVPFGIFLLIYICGFSFVAYMMSLLSRLSYGIFLSIQRKSKTHVILKKEKATS